MKKVLTFLFALALFSCRPVVNQPTSKSSASDSVELKKQEAWESAHRLDSMGNYREALLLRERTLSEYCPNSAECLQYKGLRCYIENKQDSANCLTIWGIIVKPYFCGKGHYPNIVPTQRSAYNTKDSDVILRTNRTPPTFILPRRHRCAIWHCVTALILTW